MTTVNRRNFIRCASGIAAAGFLPCMDSSAIFGLDTVPADQRNIKTGLKIPDEGYCDQPYVVITKDGNWLCTLTTGRGVEGEPGQHIVACISVDKGKTWSELIDIEPADGPEASWVMPLIVPSGRIYVFYTYNRDNMRQVLDMDGKSIDRVDTLGSFVFKYSDDNGRTWSRNRYELPMRITEIDRKNIYEGKIFFFWGIGKPMIHRDSAYFGFSKVGNFGPGFMVSSEGWFFRSDNIVTESDPEKITWTMLPDGDIGLRSPGGAVSDEHNLIGLSDGSLYCIFRTTDGHPCHAYSRDRGHTWTKPEFACYTPGGQKIKHPRACPRMHQFKNGKFVLWFHNHGGRDYQDRNPAWITGGVEREDMIYWAQPEILLYDDDPKVRMSYPDWIEEEDGLWITETQKTIARIHKVDRTLLEGMWNQGNRKEVIRDGIILSFNETVSRAKELVMPRLPNPAEGGGITLDLRLWIRDMPPGQSVFDSRNEGGKGILVKSDEGGMLAIELFDGSNSFRWMCDPGYTGWSAPCHAVILIDGASKIVSFVMNGVLNDGKDSRQFGWGRMPAALGDINGAEKAVICRSLNGEVRGIRIYNRCLRTSEAISNWRASMVE